MAINHWSTKDCQDETERKTHHKATADAARALEQSFTAYGEVLERVEVFKYLGQLLAYNGNAV